MKDDLKPQTLVELNGYSLSPHWVPRVSWIVRSPVQGEDEFTADKWLNVLNWLKEDASLIKKLKEEFQDHKEIDDGHEEFDCFVDERIKDVAKENGYVFFEVIS